MKGNEIQSTVAELLAGCAVFLIPFLLYLNTLAPTVLPYDSGALQARAYVLGIGHPTGYPTFILLGKLFTYLPFGDPAYRVNLSCAVYAALAALFVYLATLRLITGDKGNLRVVCATIGAMALATSPTFWSQAVITEVYALNALCVAAALYAFFAWRDSRTHVHLLLAAFLVGLSMTAHMTSGLLVPAGLLFVLLVDGEVLRRPAVLLEGTAAFLAGLSPYLYLPIRSSMKPPMNYGDPSDWGGLISLLSGGNFKGLMFAFGLEELPGRIAMYLGSLAGQFPAPLLAVAVLGMLVMMLRDRTASVLLGFFLLGTLAFALEYPISDIEVYFLPTYLVFALWVAVGLSWLLATLRDLIRARSATFVRLFPVLLLVPALALLVPHAAATYRDEDQSENLRSRRIVEVVARNAEQGAIVLGGRNLGALQYMQFVEERRTDLMLTAVAPWNVERLSDAALRRGTVYFIGTRVSATKTFGRTEYRLVPVEPDVLYEVRTE